VAYLQGNYMQLAMVACALTLAAIVIYLVVTTLKKRHRATSDEAPEPNL